jgi:cysteinyl-tRNA synthetase
MSKSLGNFFTIREGLERYDPEVLRLFVLRAHYRSPLNYSDAHLDDARAALLRLYTALTPGAAAPAAQPDWTRPDGARFREAMDDDFNTPVAVSVLFELANEVNRSRDAAAERQLRALAGVLGLLGQDRDAALRGGLRGRAAAPEGLPDADIDALVVQRTDAKKARRFDEADRIRADLLARGVVLEDGPGGTRWRRA